MPRFAHEIEGTPLLLVRAEDTEGAPPLAPEEEGFLATLAHPKRRAEWTLGRLAAKAALARACGAPAGEITVFPGPDGAPLGLRGDRPLPHGLSISHGHGQAIAWALESGLPGVDLERVKPRPEGTFRFYLEPGERAQLLALEGTDRDAAAVVLWSLKEASWKTLRPHRGVALLDFHLGAIDARAGEGVVAVTPLGPAAELARTRGVSSLTARFVRRGELVYSWAEAR